MNQPRVPRGSGSRGGQFAASERAEADVSLNESESFARADEQFGVGGRRWPGAGFDADDADAWRGFTPKAARDWAAAGFGPASANEWASRGFGPSQAAEWQETGFWPDRAAEWNARDYDMSAAEAMEWASEGFGCDTAAEYKAVGVASGADAAKWARSGPGTVTPDSVSPWIRAGFTADETDAAAAWSSYGFDAASAGHWLRRFRLDEPAEARTWRDAGYEPMEAQDLASLGFRPEMLSPTLHFRGSTAFKIAQGTAVYEVRTTTPQDAADKGCPGATHVMVGEHEVRYGRLEPVTGKRLKKTPGWLQRRSVAAEFVCDDDPDWQPLRGYVGE